MKKLLVLLAFVAATAQATTLNPIQLLNPTGSSIGQVIKSTGASTAPAWGNVTAANLAAQAANTVLANVTASSASPTAFAMPSCSTSTSAIQYTSGTGFTCYANSASTAVANTFTASQTISASGSPQFVVNDTGGAGTPRLQIQSNGTGTWGLIGDNTANTFALLRYVAGVATDRPISVANSTGVVTMSDGITGSPISGSTGSFTTLAASSTVSGAGFTTLLSPYALLASPTFTGTPAAPTAAAGTNTTQLATTAFANTVFAAPPCYGCTTAAAVHATTVNATSAITPSTTAGIVGTTLADSAQAGSVGEIISSSVASGSAISLTNATAANVTSISLTAGDWDVYGNIGFAAGAGCIITSVQGSFSTTSATQATLPNGGGGFFIPVTFATANGPVIPVGVTRFNVSTTTTIFLVATSGFSGGTNAAYGFIGARRRR